MKKSLLVSSCFIAFISLSFVVSVDEPLYKNLKVLPKRITKTEMDSVMKSFTVALGVKCNFCHVRQNDEQKTWNFASDSNNHKKIARTMIRMTGDINKKYFGVRNSRELTADLEVTCYTCHGGKAHPAKLPTLPKATSDSAAKK